MGPTERDAGTVPDGRLALLMQSPGGLVTLALGAALVGALLTWAVENLVPGSLPGGDRARVERVVHDYLLAHPEIIPQAMDGLHSRETAKLVAANADLILHPVGNAWAGNPDGDVTLVEYFDYACAFCRASLPTIAQLIASDPGVKIVYRELPILSAVSADAARFSLAAAEQGKFAAFHDALYAAGPLSSDTIAAAATHAGLDLRRAAAFTPRAEAEIAANMTVARQLALTGTPSWVIGDKVVSAALPLEELQKDVAAARHRG